MKKKIIIIGAGPGGLTSGMLLSHRGFDVHIFEKEKVVGGRNASITTKEGFSFDIGPTFLMMRFILDEVFKQTNRNTSDYLELIRLDPMYRLFFKERTVDMTDNHEKMKELIVKHFPGNEKGYEEFLENEKKRYDKMYPCLKTPYLTIQSLWNQNLLKAYPHLSLHKSMYNVLSDYFKDEDLRIAFTFQSKYLGMSPWSCPAAFMIIPYIEHVFGVYHVTGGLSKISDSMEKIIKEEKGKIHFNKSVEKLILEGKKVTGVRLENGEEVLADEVIINSDFGYSMSKLVPEEGQKYLKRWSKKRITNKKFSCSTFMIYLGLDKLYDVPHHNIVFSEDYKKYIQDISKHQNHTEDLSFYIRNASINDPTIAPKGKSNIYILVPVSNNKADFDWEENKQSFRDKIISVIKQRTSMKDIDKHIVFEKIITPKQWEEDYNVFLGATFNLGHNLSQMLYMRPRNEFKELENCYLAGGGTHPGSGLPTIYESGKITADLITRKYSAD